MLILAMESSAKPASVAVCLDGELLGLYFQNSGLTHSRTLLSMAESLLKNLDLSVSDIELVAISSGPGSFTGVRIGVSAAKGLAWGLDIPVCGVSTLEAMAYQTPEPGVILCPAMDARRGQVYNALFKWQSGAPVRLCDDRAISLEELASDLSGLCKSPSQPHSSDAIVIQEPVITHPSCLIVGDGAKICYDFLAAAGISCKIASGLTRWQTAHGVALAALNAASIPAIELEPSYLRPSQAERELSARA